MCIRDRLTKALFNLLLDKIVYHGIGLAAARRTQHDGRTEGINSVSYTHLETDFFRLINEAGDCNMETAYTAFATQVIELCLSLIHI